MMGIETSVDHELTATRRLRSPRYDQLMARLRHQLLTGQLKHGSRLPTEKELCRGSGYSRNTIRRAMAELEAEGLIRRTAGSGTFVEYRRSRRQQRLIALLVHLSPRRQWGLVRPIVEHAQRTAESHGYETLVVESDPDRHIPVQAAARINAAKAAGTIYFPFAREAADTRNQEAVEALLAAGQQVVVIDTTLSDRRGRAVSSVISENRRGAYLLTRHLMQHGYRQIAFLTWHGMDSVKQREDGFRAAMGEAGLAIPPEYLLHMGSPDVGQQGRQEVDVFMAMRQPPQAIVCLHDLVALNVLQRCAQRGWRVPDDVAVAGFDDLPEAATAAPALTTMRQAPGEMGRRAMQQLLAQLADPTTPPVQQVVPCELIVRRSCGCGGQQKNVQNTQLFTVSADERNRETTPRGAVSTASQSRYGDL